MRIVAEQASSLSCHNVFDFSPEFSIGMTLETESGCRCFEETLVFALMGKMARTAGAALYRFMRRLSREFFFSVTVITQFRNRPL